MKVVIEKIEFMPEEIEQIYNSLIERFDEDKAAGTTGGQMIRFFLDEITEIESTLELYQEGYPFDENHQTSLKNQSVMNFKLTVFYDGTGVNTNVDLGERISNQFYK
jgi:hypothetical protein